jgi:hypothetical protein
MALNPRDQDEAIMVDVATCTPSSRAAGQPGARYRAACA